MPDRPAPRAYVTTPGLGVAGDPAIKAFGIPFSR